MLRFLKRLGPRRAFERAERVEIDGVPAGRAPVWVRDGSPVDALALDALLAGGQPYRRRAHGHESFRSSA